MIETYVTVAYRAEDTQGNRANVIGIHQSAEQAARAVNDDATHRTDMFTWPLARMPRLGEEVEVSAGQMVVHGRAGLLDLWDTFSKRREIQQLSRTNEALQQQNHQLTTKLAVDKTVYHSRLKRESTKYQARHLWIASSGQRARENLIADFARAECPTLMERVMLVPDQQTVEHCNRLAQENRLERDDFDPGCGIAHNRALLHRGDRVQFYRGDEDLSLRAGDLGEIISVYPQRRTVAVVLNRTTDMPSGLIFVPLQEYTDVDLGYATTYEQAHEMNLYQVFILADAQGNTPELVAALCAPRVEIYADRLTAQIQFPQLAGNVEMAQTVDLQADPLSPYMRER